jgi:hypothetical protein
MKPLLMKPLGMLGLVLLLAAGAGSVAYAQDARLRISDLDRLEARASQVIDVNIDERLLQIAIKFLNPKDPNQARVRELVAGLKGVYVKSYDFDKPGSYSVADVEPINMQLKAPGWSRMVGVKSARDKQTIEVFTMLVGDKIGGMAVIATGETQLTVVNIVGPIDLEKLAALEGNFGIPRLEIKKDDRKPKE